MSRSRKILPGLGIGLLLVGVLVASLWPHRGAVPVHVERVERRNLISTVRATGQVIPKVYTNVLGQGFGRITRILVHEGQFVQPGQLLLQVDPVRAAAAVRAVRASLAAAEAGLRSARSAVDAARATVAQRQADVREATFNWEHGRKLYQAKVISRQAFESYRVTYKGATAALDSARAQLDAARDGQSRALGAVNQIRATLTHSEDVLRKTSYRAPIAGTVTNIAVRVGENVIQGVPEANGAYLMTISDLSQVMAQVGVDENDVMFLRIGQPVELSIDAYPGRTFAGKVTRVGQQAILSTTGAATSQVVGGGSAQQATDYKVDISLEHLPPGIRPGMTVNTMIQTANRRNVVGVPFQALVLRPKNQVGRTKLPRATQATTVQIAASPGKQGSKPAGLIGVFVVRKGRAIFTPVDVGVIGETYVEARKGPNLGDEIVVGGFVALRELQSGMAVRIVKRN